MAWASAGVAAADQAGALLLLVSRDGDMMCLRSREAPHLEPADLAEVLRNDRTARLMASVASAKDAGKAPPELPKKANARLRYLFEDWFTTRSTARPVGGHGLVKVEGEEKEAEAAEGEADVEEAEGDGEEDDEGVTEADEGDDEDVASDEGEDNDEEAAGGDDEEDEGEDDRGGDDEEEEEDDDG